MSYPPQNWMTDTRGTTFSASKKDLNEDKEPATLEEVNDALRKADFEACELIVGVDFTKSNLWNGKRSFNGRSLHDLNDPPNPYITTLQFVVDTLPDFDDDKQIHCYGFGDVTTKESSVFSFFPGNNLADGLKALFQRYKEIAASVYKSGPTSFAPLIRQAMRDVYDSGMKFHMLLILADGQISEECFEDTKKAINEATAFPMSIVMIGIGDGPWNEMKNLDNMALPERTWDNFQFVELDKFTVGPDCTLVADRRDMFQKEILEELPRQYRHARSLVGEANKGTVTDFMTTISGYVVMDPPK